MLNKVPKGRNDVDCLRRVKESHALGCSLDGKNAATIPESAFDASSFPRQKFTSSISIDHFL